VTKKTEPQTESRGRPVVLPDASVIYITGPKAKTILQSGSDRRALINRIVDRGRVTVQELNESFGYDVRPLLLALQRQGWIGESTKRKMKMPRRTKAMLAS
jgi:hypothetical protein